MTNILDADAKVVIFNWEYKWRKDNVWKPCENNLDPNGMDERLLDSW